MKDEGMINMKLFVGFALGQTDKRTDIFNSRVAFATEKHN